MPASRGAVVGKDVSRLSVSGSLARTRLWMSRASFCRGLDGAVGVGGRQLGGLMSLRAVL